MKYLVQTDNIIEEKDKDLDYDRIVLDNTDGNVYVIEPKYKLIDLGLPSGTLWMDRNVGAEKDTDYGLYFAWGETQGYTADEVGKTKQFDWSDYKYANGAYNKLTKYCNDSDYGNDGYTDNLTELELSDDAAYTYTNGKAKMPTRTQLQELIDETTYTLATKDGVRGGLFTSKVNSKSIFVPHAGYYYNGSQIKGEDFGYLWSSSLYDFTPYNAFHCYLYYGGADTFYFDYHCQGEPVRGVFKND